jgi:hypothetical protein
MLPINNGDDERAMQQCWKSRKDTHTERERERERDNTTWTTAENEGTIGDTTDKREGRAEEETVDNNGRMKE